MILLLKENRTYFFLIIGIFILSFSLFFPVSSDLAAFIQGGMILHNGGSLYVDYFDVKPPFVFYSFEILYSIFGKNIFLYRLFDFLYQTIFLLSSVYIFSKLRLKNNYIKVYLVLMPLSYVTVNYSNIMQMESFLFLPLLWYYYLSVKTNRNNYIESIIKGILLGIIINLKYTFGLIFIADLYINFSNLHTYKLLIRLYLLQFLTALIVTIIFFLPIILGMHLDNFFMFSSYLKIYSLYPQLNFDLIIYMIKTSTSFFTENYSISLFISALIAIYKIKNDKNSQENWILKTSLIFFIILFISIILERKLLIYHELRIYVFLVLFSSVGIVHVFKRIITFKRTTMFIIISLMIVFSSLPRLMNFVRLPFYKISFSEEKYLSIFDDGNKELNLGLINNSAKYLNNNYDTDKLLFINSGGNELIMFLENQYRYSMPVSAFYLNKFAPPELIDKLDSEIDQSEIIVVQKNDSSVWMFFNNDNSYTALKKKTKLWDNINKNFEIDTVIYDTFIIYKRLGTE